jgi:RNA-binding protein (KH domain)
MKELIETIARALVDKPELVIVKESETEEGILLELSVDETDMGKVIGKSGKIAKAIRNVVKAAAKGNDKKVVFEIR